MGLSPVMHRGRPLQLWCIFVASRFDAERNLQMTLARKHKALLTLTVGVLTLALLGVLALDQLLHLGLVHLLLHLPAWTCPC